MEKYFRAPWSNVLKAMTMGVLLFFGGLVYFSPSTTTIVISLLITVGSALFGVRSYGVVDQQLQIHRLGWNTTFDLEKLKEVEIERNAMKGSWRLFGIGGYFGFIGSFRNSILGNYRAYATHRLNCVVLTFEDKKIVVTPGAPQDFAEAVRSAANL